MFQYHQRNLINSVLLTKLKVQLNVWDGKHFTIQNNRNDIVISRKLGFKSKECPPPCCELIPFKKDLSDMVTSLKFRDVKDSF